MRAADDATDDADAAGGVLLPAGGMLLPAGGMLLPACGMLLPACGCVVAVHRTPTGRDDAAPSCHLSACMLVRIDLRTSLL